MGTIILIGMGLAGVAACVLLYRTITKSIEPRGSEPYMLIFPKKNRETMKFLLRDSFGIRACNTIHKPIRFNCIVDNRVLFRDTNGDVVNLPGWVLEPFLEHLEKGQTPEDFDWYKYFEPKLKR